MAVQCASDGNIFIVNRLKVASWLYINNQRLIGRQLDALGQSVVYYFVNSPEIESLVDQWITKQGKVDLQTMSIFSESVSFEIRVAERLRRGEEVANMKLPPRLKESVSDSYKRVGVNRAALDTGEATSDVALWYIYMTAPVFQCRLRNLPKPEIYRIAQKIARAVLDNDLDSVRILVRPFKRAA